MRQPKPTHKKYISPNCRQTKPFTKSPYSICKRRASVFLSKIKIHILRRIYSVLFGIFIIPQFLRFVNSKMHIGKVKEQNSPARGEFTPSGMSAGRRHSEAQGESFAVCGRRLKKLFSKSFLRIFKNFPLFNSIEKIPPIWRDFYLQLATSV